MTLPDFLQPESPFRPWALAAGACLLACLSPRTRRVCSILFFVVLGVAAISFFLNHAFAEFAPSG